MTYVWVARQSVKVLFLIRKEIWLLVYQKGGGPSAYSFEQGFTALTNMKMKKNLLVKCMGVVVPMAMLLCGCSGGAASSAAGTNEAVSGSASSGTAVNEDGTDAATPSETPAPVILNTAFADGVRSIGTLPDTCRLSREEMKEAINGYVDFVHQSGATDFVAKFGDDDSVSFVAGETKNDAGESVENVFRKFTSIEECFTYLYECHQVTIGGAITEFAQGKSYSHALVDTITPAADSGENADSGNPDDTASSKNENAGSSDSEPETLPVSFSSGNAANFVTSDTVIGVNYPNASVKDGDSVSYVRVAIGGTGTTNVLSMTTDYVLPSGVTASDFNTKSARISFKGHVDDATMSEVMANVMFIVPEDNGTEPIPVAWTLYDENDDVIGTVTNSFTYSNLV